MSEQPTSVQPKAGVFRLLEKIGIAAIVVGFISVAVIYWSTQKLIEKSQQLAGDLMIQIGADQKELKEQNAKLDTASGQIDQLQKKIADTEQIIDRIKSIDPEQLRRVLDVVQRPDVQRVADLAKDQRDIAVLARQVANVYELAACQLYPAYRVDTDKYKVALMTMFDVNSEAMLKQANNGEVDEGWTVDRKEIAKLIPEYSSFEADMKFNLNLQKQIEDDIKSGKSVAEPVKR